MWYDKVRFGMVLLHRLNHIFNEVRYGMVWSGGVGSGEVRLGKVWYGQVRSGRVGWGAVR